MVPTRNSSSTGVVERCGVGDLGRGHGRDGGVAAGTPYDLVEQLVHPLGERRDLGLLQGHAGDPGPGGGLQEERTAPGQPDRTGHEAVRRVVEEHLTGHVLSPLDRSVRLRSTACGC